MSRQGGARGFGGGGGGEGGLRFVCVGGCLVWVSKVKKKCHIVGNNMRWLISSVAM